LNTTNCWLNVGFVLKLFIKWNIAPFYMKQNEGQWESMWNGTWISQKLKDE
jgi:hypothetical protein